MAEPGKRKKRRVSATTRGAVNKSEVEMAKEKGLPVEYDRFGTPRTKCEPFVKSGLLCGAFGESRFGRLSELHECRKLWSDRLPIGKFVDGSLGFSDLHELLARLG